MHWPAKGAGRMRMPNNLAAFESHGRYFLTAEIAQATC
jgi:hypothetical protein